jgi:signal transduction histidine kinase/putative methionine-R-sulfoxide reductase with GAF domain
MEPESLLAKIGYEQLDTAVLTTPTLHIRQAEAAQQEQHTLEEALWQTSTAVYETLDVEEVLDRILEQIGRVVPYDSANIMLIENGRARIVRHRGYGRTNPTLLEELPNLVFNIETTTNLQEIIQTRRPVIIPDATLYPGWINPPGLIRTWAGIPIVIGDQVTALISIDKIEPDFYRPEHVARLSAFASQVALALQNAQLHKATQRQLEELSVLQALASASVEAANEDDLFEHATQIIGDTLYPHNFGVVLLDGSRKRLHVHPSYRIRSGVFQPDGFPIQQGITGHVVTTGQPYRATDVRIDPHYTNSDPETCSELCVPLFVGNTLIGAINAESKELNAFSDSDEYLLVTFARQLGVAIEKMRLLTETRQQAEELRLISRITRLLNATPDVTAAFPELSTDIIKLTNCTAVTLILLNERQALSQIITPGNPSMAGTIEAVFADTAVAQSIRAGHIHQSPDLAKETADPLANLLYHTGYLSYLTLPLHAGLHPIGGLALAWDQPHGYEAIPLARFQQVAHAMALALQRGRLFEEIKQWAHQLTILHNLSHEMAGLVETREIYATCARQLSQNLNFHSISIHRIDHNAQEVICEALVGPNTDRIEIGKYRQKIGQGLIGLVAQTGKPLVINDTQAHPAFLPSSRLTVRSELILPLRQGNQLIGVLNVDGAATNAFSDNDVAILTIAADQLTAALERAHLFEETRLRAAKLEALSALSTEMRLARTLEEMLPPILQRAMSVVGGSLGSLYLGDEETAEMVARNVHPPQPELLGRRFKPGEGIIGHITATGEIHITENMEQSSQARFYEKEKELVEQRQIRCGIGLPLRAQERIVGVMYISLPHEHAFTADEIEFLVAISEIGASAIDRMLLLQTLEERVAERTRALAEANEQLKELDRLKSKFVSEVSHELRTPVTNLSLYLDLFGHSKPEKHEHYLAVLHKQTDRLAQLIDDILSLSRLELGKGKIKLVPLDLNEVVHTAVNALFPRIAEAGLTLTRRLTPDLPPLEGEPNQLSLATTHLLTNAIQFTPAGVIEVRTGLDEAGSNLYLQVMDTGRGISEADRAHLFERFYRGRHATQSNIPGTGLGLSIVQEVVTLHSGWIDVESREGKGTTFTVWLPVIRNP